MESMTERRKKAEDALARLHEVVIMEHLTELERDALIHRFEFCFEILWKCAKDYLRDVEGIDAASPKKVIRMSRNVGLLTDEETEQALDMVNDRNLTSHTYDENMAMMLVEHIKGYEILMQRWYGKMNAKDAAQE
ncbi:MAG: nucleotidyltransferase substrate binding protein [Selenomonas sp.]|uniref:HI0074 family nucleotidyltransferase substrate-binding subunit n=1 Tax=Selenomonas sp. TaxID=2053611 RepID=UPI0025FAEB7F|nr:HI0074 family nucleotidyltransferase substrate-binding subunit [Selenomonas sp.]MCI6087063.1 nucleotidyltransferase substrate binding protein [Selenomonas sp.]MDY4416979.1 HI0074 family nucleotidyltransferase substrate-binding subunit [Selenomonas sp.]